MRLGIDASNLNRGGGLTHLTELLAIGDAQAHGFHEIVVWGTPKTLSILPDTPILRKISPPALRSGAWRRFAWQRFSLSAAATAAGCDILFVPGGSFLGSFRPFVTMSRNMLPFSPSEWRYFHARTRLKLRLLRPVQARSFQRADGLIFLTRYAEMAITQALPPSDAQRTVIPHGVAESFRMPPRPQRPLADYSSEAPLTLLYVSPIRGYKHQLEVLRAMQSDLLANLPIRLRLVGLSLTERDGSLFRAELQRVNRQRMVVSCDGEVAYRDLPGILSTSDVGVFASSCENMPNTLLEYMAAGLPIAASERQPMPEVLGDAGLYFDPESPESIARTLHEIIVDHEKRNVLAGRAFARAQGFSWRTCANKTFEFLARVVVAAKERWLGGAEERSPASQEECS